MRAAGKILFKILGKLLELTFFPRCGLWSGKDREGRGDLKKRDGTQFLRGGGGGGAGGGGGGGGGESDRRGKISKFLGWVGNLPLTPVRGNRLCWKDFEPEKTNEKTRKQLLNLFF